MIKDILDIMRSQQVGNGADFESVVRVLTE